MTSLTIGTHNLHDRAGRPTPFADVVLFTEAVRDRLDALDRLRGYDLIVCRRQPDLAIAYKRRLFEPDSSVYQLAHSGRERVTPHRGTWAVDGVLAGRDATLIVEHRVNAAFKPYVRGEGAFRARCWQTHTATTLDLIRGADKAGRIVVAGGDTNTPPGESAYRGALDEVGRGYDRLGVTHKGLALHFVQYLGKAGSDHPRLRAKLVIP